MSCEQSPVIYEEDAVPKSINEGRPDVDKLTIPKVTELTLPDVFGDGMLFDAGKPVIIWGLSPYKDKVIITLFNKEGTPVRAKTALPARDTSFITGLEGIDASFDEYTLEVKAGNDTIRIKNILFGRLYLVGGQSNMDMLVRDIYRKEEILTAAPNRYIRVYNPSVVPCEPDDCAMSPVFRPEKGGPWIAANDREALKNVTAVGLVFAKVMFEKLNREGEPVPVGILSTSVGGTVIETWMSKQCIEEDAELKSGMLANKVYALKGDRKGLKELKKQGLNNTNVLFNMKIAPVTNMNISGFVWYEGESMVNKNMDLFARELDAFIRDYCRRFRWEEYTLPVALINITPYPYDDPCETPELGTGMPKINETYNEFAKQHSATATSVPTYDISLRCEECETWDPHPIHPTDKIPLAERAAEMFWGLTHSNFVPAFDSCTIKGGMATCKFANTYGGLMTNNNEPVKGFRLCGGDGKYYPAGAVIVDENTVEVTAAEVLEPAAVSYAFYNMCNEANLLNARGIPVQIFRTGKE